MDLVTLSPMEMLTIIFIFSIILAIPAFLAYLIGLFANKKMVTAGNLQARRNRRIIFWVGFAVLLSAEIFILANTLEFGR